MLYITTPALAEFIRNNLLIFRLLFSAALYIHIKYQQDGNLLIIYKATKNNSRKINKLFCINSAGAGVVIYNNKISAHTQRLINYFKLMSTKTMKCPSETDKHSANTSCLSVSFGHYIISVYIISNN